MKQKNTSATRQPGRNLSPAAMVWVTAGSWGITIMVVAYLSFLLLSRGAMKDVLAAPVPEDEPVAAEISEVEALPVTSLPEFSAGESRLDAIGRGVNPRTIITNRSRTTVVEYTVQKGDSIFSIANKYKLKPETVLWANYDLLNDNPNFLSIDQVLQIPPVDGIYYQWQDNDTLDGVAGKYYVDATDIVSYPQNNLDMTNPVVEPGTYVMVPGGWRENQQWVIPTVYVPGAGVTNSIVGAGSCALSAGGLGGSGYFVWPADNHYLSGNDYWSGHMAVDIATAEGARVYAADSGVVVYAGGIGGGYGNMIMIDHGNGYHTLYARLSSVLVGCGQSVFGGSVIGLAGSTGNSTGPHLHFETRLNGGFINPWYVLP